jgi:predicted nuclease of predicted toxin-antitoxin system
MRTDWIVLTVRTWCYQIIVWLTCGNIFENIKELLRSQSPMTSYLLTDRNISYFERVELGYDVQSVGYEKQS